MEHLRSAPAARRRLGGDRRKKDGRWPMRQKIKENTTLRRLYYRLRMGRAKGQSDEGRIIADLTKDTPRTFVEFGFHPIEFNCAELARNPKWRGLLIDGDRRQVEDARSL